MDWIKKNYDQFILGLVALLLLVLSGLLINSAIGFQQTFDIIKDKVSPNNTVPPVDMSGGEQSGSSVSNPAKWTSQPGQGLALCLHPIHRQGWGPGHRPAPGRTDACIRRAQQMDSRSQTRHPG